MKKNSQRNVGGHSRFFRGAFRRGTSLLCLTLALGISACGSDKDKKESADSSEGASVGELPADGVEWLDLSFEDAMAKAEDEGKMLLVDVWSDHCAQCGIMDEEVWRTADGAELIGDALAVKVPSDAPESYAFRNKYPVTGLPSVLLLDSDGTEIDRVVGYQSKNGWFSQAYEMMTGVDPIPELETQAKANPEDVLLQITLMEKYLNRTDERAAAKAKDRILELDPDNANGHAEKAMREMARYYAFFHMDAEGSATIYRSLVESFPSASSVNSALRATFNQAKATNNVDEWVDWVCEQTKKNPDNGRLNSAIAMYAFRNKVQHSCLAEAARRAASLGAGPAGIDTVANALEP